MCAQTYDTFHLPFIILILQISNSKRYIFIHVSLELDLIIDNLKIGGGISACLATLGFLFS